MGGARAPLHGALLAPRSPQERVASKIKTSLVVSRAVPRSPSRVYIRILARLPRVAYIPLLPCPRAIRARGHAHDTWPGVALPIGCCSYGLFRSRVRPIRRERVVRFDLSGPSILSCASYNTGISAKSYLPEMIRIKRDPFAPRETK